MKAARDGESRVLVLHGARGRGPVLLGPPDLEVRGLRDAVPRTEAEVPA
ncbi:hypothetical protein ACQP2X_18955 [Actinoplanes sp. CA-131856]